MTANRLTTVVLRVADVERAARLYAEAFGVELPIHDHDGDDAWTSGRHGSTSWTDGAFLHFALYQVPDGETPSHGVQLAFTVDDLDAAHERAVAGGAEVLHAPRPQPWGRSARYHDLDGNVIELTQPPDTE